MVPGQTSKNVAAEGRTCICIMHFYLYLFLYLYLYLYLYRNSVAGANVGLGQTSKNVAAEGKTRKADRIVFAETEYKC